MCRKAIWGLLIIALSVCDNAAAQQYAFQITFTDKNNTPYNFSDPLAYLSARSLQRRANQGIALDSTDFPVNRTYVDSVLTLTGGLFHGTSRWLNMCMIFLPAADSAQILNLNGKAFISSVIQVGYYDPNIQERKAAGTGAAKTGAVTRSTSTGEAYYGKRQLPARQWL
jgi:serine protease AprX